ncbi:1-(5-phosphoribosyl)-5-((5-phosphoribosylamino)methylideneamino)imidazole-4-carboxamide isomerase [Marinicauda salina]|uniref:1-(5-phosphoribosyl)-5-[(5-phosphoribosylamino)methylideneamino] imidazole-4-carboxamide isomerase n=1 Tax=Marinicauda salina TaxID=2135793 RepID=A0A2U2BV90_9PROT|nr:1-(5-phosphoribosyl)-5-[(5-phosphoribosylamino)methylideneamino] imidazole-4-carboxamide isomerase [Marinicauda salina]PWE17935.1 1-(5-phosphoribosyl)-5-((5-phosphoribosylamino)methylideneamino)imidazole-4-carboxamide isomerase [Marinicauda salina]
MILYPAIDVLDGRVVRLAKGDFAAVTEYGDDPGAVAEGYAAAGAEWIHLVDLSGARDETRRQPEIVGAVARSGLKVQTGGGVRRRADVEALLEAGARRVVIGSLAVSDPETVAAWLGEFGPEVIATAFDVQIAGGAAWPTLKGWRERAERPLTDLLGDYEQAGLVHALVTDTGRDGLLEGPNTDLYADLVRARPDIAWQASGGVSSLEDLAALKQSGAAGAVVGKALFEGRFTLEEALKC